MINKIFLFVFASSILLFSGCSGPLNKKEYIEWVRDYDNNLHVRKEENGFIFDVQYKPVDYVLLERDISREQFVLTKESNTLQYIDLTIGLTSGRDFIEAGIGDLVALQQRIYYYSYTFQQDIYLLDGAEKLPCILYHFERSADLKGNRTFVLGFEAKNEVATDATLVINSGRFGALPVKIKISKEKIPTLEI